MSPVLEIAEYGPEGPWWYDVLAVSARGPGGHCNRDGADAWSAELKTRKRGRIDPCGSSVIKHLQVGHDGRHGRARARPLRRLQGHLHDGGEEVRDAVQARLDGVRAQVKVHLIGICGHRHGLARRAAQGGGPRRARLRRARLSAHVDAARGARRSRPSRAFAPRTSTGAPSASSSATSAARTTSRCSPRPSAKIPLDSFPSLFGKLFLEGKHSVVVAGTHGKTTTSSILAHVLADAGRDPSFLIGGVPLNFRQSWRLGQGRRVRRRGRRVRHGLLRQGLQVPALPPAHGAPHLGRVRPRRHLQDEEAVKAAFRKFVALIPEDGLLLACAASPGALEVARAARCQVMTYGRPGSGADWTFEVVAPRARRARHDGRRAPGRAHRRRRHEPARHLQPREPRGRHRRRREPGRRAAVDRARRAPVPRRAAPPGGARRRAGRDRHRRLRAPPDGHPRDDPRAQGPPRARQAHRRLRAALGDEPPQRLPGRLRRRALGGRRGRARAALRAREGARPASASTSSASRPTCAARTCPRASSRPSRRRWRTSPSARRRATPCSS